MSANAPGTPPTAATARVRVMIVEDQGLMREFLERWLRTLPRFEWTGSARTGERALQQLESARPDVLLVDFQLPGMDGLEFIRAARQVRPQSRALMVTTLTDALTVVRVRESGIEGFVEKDETEANLTAALEAVAAGRSFFSARFQETFARETAKPAGLGKILSRREQQVLGLVLEGRSNRDIADLLGLSVRTVECHRLNLMTKLDVTSLVELKQRAALLGWK